MTSESKERCAQHWAATTIASKGPTARNSKQLGRHLPRAWPVSRATTAPRPPAGPRSLLCHLPVSAFPSCSHIEPSLCHRPSHMLPPNPSIYSLVPWVKSCDSTNSTGKQNSFPECQFLEPGRARGGKQVGEPPRAGYRLSRTHHCVNPRPTQPGS